MSHDIFDCLIGRWAITRAVTDGTRMTGTGVFTLIDGDRADYHETIVSRLPTGDVLNGTQGYLFNRLLAGFETRFKTSHQLFHKMEFSIVEPGPRTASACHDCPPDIYNSRYQFDSCDRFHVAHEVIGPRKDYTIASLYTRLP